MNQRGKQRYTWVNSYRINCFAHAFFNLKNGDIRELYRAYPNEMFEYFWSFQGFKKASLLAYINVTREILKKIQQAGLQIEECSVDEKLEEGQWKVAYYFNFDVMGKDFHFMHQEPNGYWSSKQGANLMVDIFKELPETYSNGYKLQKIYKITNPYYVKENDEENE